MRDTKGLHKILGVMEKRRQVAEKFLNSSKCQIKDCLNKDVKIIESINGLVVSACSFHRNKVGIK